VGSTTTIDAPSRMGRRAQAVELLADLPRSLVGAEVTVAFPDIAFATTSFIDEVIRSVLVDRQADRLSLQNANEQVREIACGSAGDLGVTSRLTISPA